MSDIHTQTKVGPPDSWSTNDGLRHTDMLKLKKNRNIKLLPVK